MGSDMENWQEEQLHAERPEARDGHDGAVLRREGLVRGRVDGLEERLRDARL